MFIKHKDFEAYFSDAVRNVTEDLQSYFPSLAKAGTEGPRYKALHSIVEQAAKLEVETRQQLSLFKVIPINPGVEYLSAIMDDRSGKVDGSDDEGEEGEEGGEEGEEEEEDKEEEENGVRTERKGRAQRSRGFIVDTVLSPLVLRWDFDEVGNILEPEIVIRKGIVISAVQSKVDNDRVIA